MQTCMIEAIAKKSVFLKAALLSKCHYGSYFGLRKRDKAKASQENMSYFFMLGVLCLVLHRYALMQINHMGNIQFI
ncbi:hypothetical protein BKD02_14680 [Brucella sp. 09RB8910]|nr:hypothetical protein BKD02_14680 [Brucella sp. 09RB8910]